MLCMGINPLFSQEEEAPAASGTTTIGGSLDYQVPNMPLFIKAYGRGNATTTASDDFENATGWINIGVVVSYDISTLF